MKWHSLQIIEKFEAHQQCSFCHCQPSTIIVTNPFSFCSPPTGEGSRTHSEILALLDSSAEGCDAAACAKKEYDLNSSASALLRALQPAAEPSDGSNNAPAGGSPSEAGVELIAGSSLWRSSAGSLLANYTDRMASLFGAVARAGCTAADVNTWCATLTRGLITEILSPGVPFEVALVNAVYFKGRWATAFDPNATRAAAFVLPGGRGQKQVKMMEHTFRLGPGAGARIFCSNGSGDQGGGNSDAHTAVILPYQASAAGMFSAACILPPPGAGAVASLRWWLANGAAVLAADDAGSNGVISRGGQLRVRLPRFRASSSVSLGDALQACGIQAAFQQGRADFSRLAPDGCDLALSEVLQKVVVEVSESGTVAAAVTAAVLTRCLPPPPIEVTFDRPFAFVVLETRTGTTLFAGVVNEPSE